MTAKPSPLSFTSIPSFERPTFFRCLAPSMYHGLFLSRTHLIHFLASTSTNMLTTMHSRLLFDMLPFPAVAPNTSTSPIIQASPSIAAKINTTYLVNTHPSSRCIPHSGTMLFGVNVPGLIRIATDTSGRALQMYCKKAGRRTA